jgi:integrase
MGKLFKRGRIWQAWVRERSGRWTRKSTNCTDRRAAETVAADFERDAADPSVRASRSATTQRILDDYAASRKRIGRSEGTLHHVRKNAGNLLALLPSRAEDITHPACERFVDARLAEGVRRTTIKKDLRVLKAALKLARKNGLWAGSPDDVIPELEDDYEPGKRVLGPWELVGLTGVLSPRRMAIVAWCVATGCEFSAIWRARAEDVAPDCSSVAIHGTKRKTRERVVPLALPGQRALVGWALRHADGRAQGDLLFAPWANMRRDLAIAARKLDVPSFSANDLRRTFGTWLRNAGVEPQLIAPAMGHVDSRMVESVYGRLTTEALGKLLEERVGLRKPSGEVLSSTSIGRETIDPCKEVVARQPGDASASPAGLSDGALLMCDDQVVLGITRQTLRTLGTLESLRISGISGAQGRNRTADTGIFSRSVTSPEAAETLGTKWSVGVDGAPLMRCGPAPDPWVHEATVNLYELLMAQAGAA